MSLGKLLATGRSLVGGPGAGRYQLSNRNQFPKFGSAKNPFAAAAMPAAAPVPAPASSELLAPEAVQPVAGVMGTVTPAEPVVTVAPSVVAEMKQPRRTAKQILQQLRLRFAPKIRGGANAAMGLGRAVLARLLPRLRKLTGRMRRAEPRSVIPRFGRPSLQAELSLDNVKVVRNDLHESDLEIVVAETATSTQLAPTAPVATPHRGPVPPALKKITGRIIGAKTI